MSISSARRLSAVLPELLNLARLRRQATPDQVANAGVRAGGFFAWGIGQGRFGAELLGREIADSCERALSRAIQPPSLPGVTVLDQLPGDDAIAVFQAAGEAGQRLRVLRSLPREDEKLAADVRLIDYVVGMLPSFGHRVSRKDLVRLIEDVSRAAMLERDLGAELAGLRLAAAQPRRFDAPEVISQSDGILVVTDIAGAPVPALSAQRRHAVYHDVVMSWARMLLDDGVLSVSVRRDRIQVTDSGVGLTRWTGTRLASNAAAALIRHLALAAFGATEASRAVAREQATQLLADGFGLEGSLEEIEKYCLSLMAEDKLPKPSRQDLRKVAVRQSTRYTQEQRLELFLLLRQLIWLRDLGFACGVSDLSGPWRELAPELASSADG